MGKFFDKAYKAISELEDWWSPTAEISATSPGADNLRRYAAVPGLLIWQQIKNTYTTGEINMEKKLRWML